jgi:acetylglutamate kinase
MMKPIEKANTLIEALPYIKRFYGKTIVIKYGGHAMENEELKESFAQDIVLMKYIGMNPVIVHGGGPQIDELLKRLGKKTEFKRGLRVTDEETMEIVEMVLVGKVNKDIVSLINRHGGQAVGLSGRDGGLIRAKKIKVRHRDEAGREEVIDIGRVGEADRINPQVIESLDESRFIPVIAPVGEGEDGKAYNINADLVAGKIASALKAEKFILLTDVEGVLDNNKRLISTLSVSDIADKVEKGVVTGGMIPKVECCADAVKEGVSKAHIIDGRVKHAILLEVFTDKGIGTEIVKE